MLETVYYTIKVLAREQTFIQDIPANSIILRCYNALYVILFTYILFHCLYNNVEKLLCSGLFRKRCCYEYFTGDPFEKSTKINMKTKLCKFYFWKAWKLSKYYRLKNVHIKHWLQVFNDCLEGEKTLMNVLWHCKGVSF